MVTHSSDFRTPIRSLEQGLLLERRGVLLPWGASLEWILSISQPDQVEHYPIRDTLFWEKPVVLGGLVGDQLEINLAPQGGFYLAWIWLENGEIKARSEEAFHKAMDHLEKFMGNPGANIMPGSAQFDLLVTWQVAAVSIGLEMRHSLDAEGARYSSKLNIFSNT